MPIVDRTSVLRALTVREAMRRLICHLDKDATIQQAIRYAIKYKVNAILITSESNEAIGVVSKSNFLGAYYVGLPLNIPLEAILVAPPLFCHVNDSLDTALDMMRTRKVHRLYVQGEEPLKAIGVLAYPDILGILYRYCRKCEYSRLQSPPCDSGKTMEDHFRVGDLMNASFPSHGTTASLMLLMESIVAQDRSHTVLITGENATPIGVVSTFDLILAYLHEIPLNSPASVVMSAPVHACDYDDPLVIAIQKMVFLDLHNLFVHRGIPENIVGTISLSDAAMARSGSCRACIITRINPDR
jgi:CBS domain-containing protein